MTYLVLLPLVPLVLALVLATNRLIKAERGKQEALLLAEDTINAAIRVGFRIVKTGDGSYVFKFKPFLPKRREDEMPTDEASHLFWDCFQWGGTAYAECVCDRVHFVTSEGSLYEWGDGELERLMQLAIDKPDKYIANNLDDSLALCDLGRGTIVWGCPCREAAKHENWINMFQTQILNAKESLLAQTTDTPRTGLV
jgi:hypothetical protein